MSFTPKVALACEREPALGEAHTIQAVRLLELVRSKASDDAIEEKLRIPVVVHWTEILMLAAAPLAS
jgi:hypothetical protein